MIKSQLILVEGMPSTGKSTNSQKIDIQLERNGIEAQWVHEVAMPQPVLFFDEVGLTLEEYKDFLLKYPEAADVLNHIAEFRESTVGINLNDIQWYYQDKINEEVVTALKAYDVWNYLVDQYKRFALDKWSHFTRQALHNKEKVYIIDSAIFQFQIFTFLLENKPFQELLEFVNHIVDIIEPLNPSLILLYRKDVEETINYLEKDRGSANLEGMYQRDKNLPYYEGKPVGAEGYKQFLRDYNTWANRLFDSLSVKKLSVDITGGNWPANEAKMLSFLDLKLIPDINAYPKEGVYKNVDLGFDIRIDGLSMIDPTGKNRRLIPKSENEFYVEWLPVCILFQNDEIIITGSQICERWTITGLRYRKECK